MNLLLDTHIILWWLSNDPSLSENHRKMISDSNNVCFISAASIWEISIKTALGKLVIPCNYIDELRSEGFKELSITWRHSRLIRDLSLYHRDPFDRMLIAQAKLENFTLLTVDEAVLQYDITAECCNQVF